MDALQDALVHIKLYLSGSTGKLSSPRTLFHCGAVVHLTTVPLKAQ